MSSPSDRGQFRKSLSPGFRLRDSHGTEKTIRMVQFEDGEEFARAKTTDDDTILFPIDALATIDKDVAVLPAVFDEYRPSSGRDIVMPVYEEQVQVDKRKVELDSGIRVRKQVIKKEQPVDMPLMHEDAEVIRVPVGKVLDAAAPLPEQRHEGATLVVPVLEEILVVEKRVRLVEEIRITKRRQETRFQETIPLRIEKMEIERFEEDDSRSTDPSRDHPH